MRITEDQRKRWGIGIALISIFVSLGGWGGTLSGHLNPPFGAVLEIVGVAGIAAAVVWMFLPWLRSSLVRRPKLLIEPAIEWLSYAYPPEWNGSLMEAGFHEKVYGLLRVRNEWKKDLHKVVARCSLSTSGAEIPCFWSSEPDGKFASGARAAADLPVWHQRVLVIAQAFGKNKIWARLPADQANLFRTSSFSLGPFAQRVTSAAGESLEMSGKVDLIVRFRAENLEQAERFTLSFDSEGPSITPCTRR